MGKVAVRGIPWSMSSRGGCCRGSRRGPELVMGTWKWCGELDMGTWKWCTQKKNELSTRYHAGFAKPGDMSWMKARVGVVSIGHA